MGDNINTLIYEYKNGNTDNFVIIADKMEPLINKYVHLLYKDDKEDMYSEFILPLLESINQMDYYNEEGQCVYFLCKAIKNKFYELYKKSKKYYDNVVYVNEEYFYNIRSKKSEYENIIIMEDLFHLLSKTQGKQYQILYSIIFKNETDTEIAKEIAVSRQYANRIRRNFYDLLKEEYFK